MILRLPHELFVGDLAVRYGDAAAFLVTGAAADDVLPLNLHHPHRGLVILLFHILFFYLWVAYGSKSYKILSKIQLFMGRYAQNYKKIY